MGELGQVPDDMWSTWGLPLYLRLLKGCIILSVLFSQESHFS